MGWNVNKQRVKVESEQLGGRKSDSGGLALAP